MSLHTVHSGVDRAAAPRPGTATTSKPGFAATLFALAGVLAVNTVLGPLGTETIQYPITGTLLNQTIGLEAVTVGLVAPLAVAAGVLALRGHRAAAFLGFGAAAYTAYMFVQYVLGPEYADYTPTILFHTLIFAFSAGLTGWAWAVAVREPVPQLSDRRRHTYGVILLVLAAFIVSRYLAVVSGGVLPAEFTQARTFFWSIFLLDLGVVVPATLLAGVQLLRGVLRAHTALYTLLGWYALVPPSVAAMSATMVINDDPHAVTGQAVMFAAVAAVVAAVATWIYWPLLHTDPDRSR